VVCATSGTNVIMAIAPVDSFQYSTMRFGGYAVRDATTGIYSYVSGGTIAAADVSNCHGAPKIYADTVTMGGRQGKVVQVTTTGALPAGTVAGSMAMIWQNVRYVFATSKIYSNRLGLYRITYTSAAADTNELIAPFSTTARFNYYVSKGTPTSTTPTNLNSIIGLQIYLAAEAADTVQGRTGPKKSPLTTAVFFKNTRLQ